MLHWKKTMSGAAVVGGLWLATGQAFAVPMTSPATPAPSAQSGTAQAGQGLVEKATYYRHRGWRYRNRGPQVYFGFGPRWYGGYPRRHWRYQRGGWW